MWLNIYARYMLLAEGPDASDSRRAHWPLEGNRAPHHGGGTQDTDFDKGFTKGFFHYLMGYVFPKRLGLDSTITSWDLKIRIPRQKLRICSKLEGNRALLRKIRKLPCR